MGLKEDILFLEIVYFLFGESSAATMAGGAQRPVGRGNEPKKTDARSARARTRGQNPLVHNIPAATVHIIMEQFLLLLTFLTQDFA